MKNMSAKKLDLLISQYAQVRARIEEKQNEADFLRDKIAQILLATNGQKYKGATAYEVTEHRVKSYTRQGYTAIRISRG